ncbi:hypothetical protein RHMOL_Rhmol13G0153800 [Rhododendron molle]|uniref:Uncharacterized protein n=1 Tax=Rhododendron molle TaxID=49168 RepID=A0ACC0L8M4_RHOML|nr:hypothetical protein RHMOL_Rhmol13G0153800 [Rhododendron molle]
MAHRRWREEEEDTLLTNLTSLVDQGVWRTNNGHFKPSYLGVLTNEMKVSFPRADAMLRRPGFGWNPNENKLVVENEIWNEFVQVSTLKFFCQFCKKYWFVNFHNIFLPCICRITDFRDISETSNFPILIDGPIALLLMRTRSSKFKAGIGRIN